MKTEIFLLDLDGVLIRPGGYRAAVRASMEYLLRQMGLDLAPPEDAVPALFESQGITSEWDMVSILLALLLNAVANQVGRPLPPVSLGEALEWAAQQDTRGFSVDYAATVRALAGAVPAGELPMTAMQAVIAERRYPELFSRLDSQPFVGELFNPARNVHTSLPTRLVQNYVLGHQVFEGTYGLPGPVEASSLLSRLDAPALNPETAAEMLDRARQGCLYMSAFTARPSLPPRDADAPHLGYSPEAEMALRLIGYEDIAIMGYGRLEWLAGQVGGYADQYLKPAVEQPLAAAYAALTGRESQGLLWAYQAARGQARTREHPFPGRLRLHVFEDSPIGLIAGGRAAQVLADLGILVELRRWGVTTVAEKETALKAAGADRVFADMNVAVRAAFEAV